MIGLHIVQGAVQRLAAVAPSLSEPAPAPGRSSPTSISSRPACGLFSTWSSSSQLVMSFVLYGLTAYELVLAFCELNLSSEPRELALGSPGSDSLPRRLPSADCLVCRSPCPSSAGKVVIAIFFREIRPRGAFNIPRDGPVLFVAAPHHNQVRTSLGSPRRPFLVNYRLTSTLCCSSLTLC